MFTYYTLLLQYNFLVQLWKLVRSNLFKYLKHFNIYILKKFILYFLLKE